MVAAEHNALLFYPEHAVAGGVSRNCQRFEGVFSHSKGVALFKPVVSIGYLFYRKLHRRIQSIYLIYHLNGKSLGYKTASAQFFGFSGKKSLHICKIDVAHVNMSAHTRKQIRHTRMIGVKVGQQHITARRIGTEFFQPLFKRFPALIASEARIYQQIGIFTADKIAVKLFKRIFRQRYAYPVYIFCHLLNHARSSFLRKCVNAIF